MVLKALNCYAKSPGALPDRLEAGTRTIGPVSLAKQRDPPSSLPHPLSSTVVGQSSQGVIFIRERIDLQFLLEKQAVETNSWEHVEFLFLAEDRDWGVRSPHRGGVGRRGHRI